LRSLGASVNGAEEGSQDGLIGTSAVTLARSTSAE
jgi:hypothetical protein